ncbi:S-adenosyl-L-methionine-dependent methyltransferase [Gongronella butleri]|nr:S-adenosyl-L-methionine-dependent methyltransferase [Gongronella butleri]
MTSQEVPIDDKTFKLFKDYVGVTSKEELETHLIDVQRELLKASRTFRCIESFRFAVPRITYRFYYDLLLDYARSHTNPILLDIGCCAGTDLRQLYVDGYPGDCLVGMDESQHFIECGYALFKDKDRCPVQFQVGDMLSIDRSDTKVAVIMAGSLIHLLRNADDVHALVARVAQWLRAGGLFVGAHVAIPHSGHITRRGESKFYFGKNDLHDLLVKHHFGNIRMETQPHTDIFVPDSPAFWLSFSCIYSPPS